MINDKQVFENKCIHETFRGKRCKKIDPETKETPQGNTDKRCDYDRGCKEYEPSVKKEKVKYAKRNRTKQKQRFNT